MDTTNGQKEATTTEILAFLKDNMVMRSEFDAEISLLRKGMATKEDLMREIGKLRSDMIDHVDKKILELTTMIRAEDRKFFALGLGIK